LPIADFQLASGVGHQSAIGNHKSAVSLRDGVTGNTSGFELEDEGSIPSPATNLSSKTQKGTSIVIQGNESSVVSSCNQEVTNNGKQDSIQVANWQADSGN
jgi:hypothetical protein